MALILSLPESEANVGGIVSEIIYISDLTIFPTTHFVTHSFSFF